MAGDDLGIALGVADRKLGLFIGAFEEAGETRDDRNHPGRGEAAGRCHHVLFGDAELDQPVGMGFAPVMHAGAAGDVRVEYDDFGKFRGQTRQRLAEVLVQRRRVAEATQAKVMAGPMVAPAPA